MLANLQQDLKKAKDHLQGELAKLQVGRANPAIVEGIIVVAYDNPQPLKNIASVSNLDAQTLLIEPWDKSLLHDIEKGISNAKIGINPNNNGENIILNIPPLNEERRKEIVRVAAKMHEDAKISVRNIRSEYKKRIETAKNDKNLSEDEAKIKEQELQKSIDTLIIEIQVLSEEKEKDIMRV